MNYKMRFLFFAIVGVLLANAGELSFRDDVPSDMYEMVCQATLGWGDQCTDYSQAVVGGVGGTAYIASQDTKLERLVQAPGEDLTAAIGNQADCLRQVTKDGCESLITRDGAPCAWCDHTGFSGWTATYQAQFGSGSCSMKYSISGLACSFVKGVGFDNMMKEFVEKGQDLPSAVVQAKCIELTGDDQACEQESDCSVCTVPDVYAWRWNNDTVGATTSLCYPKILLEGGGVSDGWCGRLKSVPKNSSNKLALTTSTTTSLPTSSNSRPPSSSTSTSTDKPPSSSTTPATATTTTTTPSSAAYRIALISPLLILFANAAVL